MGFIRSIFDKEQAKRKYWLQLKDLLSNNELSLENRKLLEEFAHLYDLQEKDLRSSHEKALSLVFTNICNDQKISTKERESLNELMKYFGLTTKDFNFDQEKFNKFYALGQIDEGVMPVVEQHNLNIIFKEGEVLYWVCPAVLKKFKHVTQRVGYAGLRTSIRIAKGVSYRVGSYKVETESKEFLVPEDSGAFWLTNKRIGFKGQRKEITIAYNKVNSFDLHQSGLMLAKEGRENPYIVVLKDYDVPLSILSHILNTTT